MPEVYYGKICIPSFLILSQLLNILIYALVRVSRAMTMENRNEKKTAYLKLAVYCAGNTPK